MQYSAKADELLLLRGVVLTSIGAFRFSISKNEYFRLIENKRGKEKEGKIH